MLRSVLISLALHAGSIHIGLSQQLPNSDFENWDNLGTSVEEPKFWNGVMTGDLCLFCSMGASQRVFQDQNEKVSGRYSLRIESKTILGGLIFNGTATTGRVVAPGTTPSDGFSQTRRNQHKFNLPFSYEPDSLVFWAKYNVTDESDSALVSFFIHGDVDLKDPTEKHSAIVGVCQQTFQTNGKWKRISMPFKYLESVVLPDYLLATFSSSFAAGKGNGNAKLWVDKVELVYNNQLTMETE